MEIFSIIVLVLYCIVSVYLWCTDIYCKILFGMFCFVLFSRGLVTSIMSSMASYKQYCVVRYFVHGCETVKKDSRDLVTQRGRWSCSLWGCRDISSAAGQTAPASVSLPLGKPTFCVQHGRTFHRFRGGRSHTDGL